ncbi:MAG: glycosyltransferase family 39 protein [Patescibacteria group bacterium]|jgi:4-amino-4-deoxy-L-arabinose transferase-like glycosyltransferase
MFNLIPLSIFIAIFIPNILTKGLFFDGLTYSSIARNLSQNIGSFWYPHYTKTLYPNFYEQPPLGLYIQSLFFRLFGDQYYVEKICSVFFGFLTLLSIYLFYYRLQSLTKNKISIWVILILWMFTPVSRYVINNNLLDGLATPFMLIAGYFILSDKKWTNILGGLFLCISISVKGLPYMFIIFIPIFFYILKRNKGTLTSILITINTILIFLITAVNFSQTRDFFTYYLNIRIIKSFTEYRVVDNHFFLLRQLFYELKIPLLISFIILLITRKINNKKYAIIFFLTGFLGFVPYLLSFVQYDRYLYPSIIFFIFGLVLVNQSFFNILENTLIKIKFIKYIFIFVFVIITAVSLNKMVLNQGKIIDQITLHSNFDELTNTFNKRRVFNVCPTYLIYDWELIAFLQRYNKISIGIDEKTCFLLTKKNKGCQIPLRCKAFFSSLDFQLYNCQN